MKTLKIVFSQTLWQLLGKFITSLTTLFVLSVIARIYGEYGTGLYTLSLTYLSFFYLLVDLGINAAILPLLDRGDPSLIFRKILGLRLIVAGFLIISAFLFLPFTGISDPRFYTCIALSCLSILGAAIFASANAFFQWKLSYHLSILASSLSTLAGALLIMFFITNNNSIEILVSVQLFSWFICACISLFLLRGIVSKITPIIDFGFIIEIFRNTWPISLTLLVNMIYFRVDSFILGSQLGMAVVGTYTIAYTLFQAVLVIPTYITNSYYPIMLQDLIANKVLFLRNIIRASLSMFLIGLIGCGITFLFAPIFIKLVAGSEGFSGAEQVLKVLSTGFPAYFATAIIMWALVTLKRYKTVLLVYVLGLCCTVVLNLLLIPHFGFFGAAFATSASEYLILSLQLLILYTTLVKK